VKNKVPFLWLTMYIRVNTIINSRVVPEKQLAVPIFRHIYSLLGGRFKNFSPRVDEG